MTKLFWVLSLILSTTSYGQIANLSDSFRCHVSIYRVDSFTNQILESDSYVDEFEKFRSPITFGRDGYRISGSTITKMYSSFASTYNFQLVLNYHEASDSEGNQTYNFDIDFKNGISIHTDEPFYFVEHWTPLPKQQSTLRTSVEKTRSKDFRGPMGWIYHYRIGGYCERLN